MVKWSETSCFRSRLTEDTGKRASRGGLQSGSGEAALHHDHYHPAASITEQTPAAYRGDAKGQLYFGKLAAAVTKCSSCSFSVSTTDTTTVLQWDWGAPGTLGNNQSCVQCSLFCTVHSLLEVRSRDLLVIHCQWWAVPCNYVCGTVHYPVHIL